ncbi:hypothetical protein VTL71DRAFT_9195 [Oculimacula yallundae]|uniref:Uncharacterized protein n=1 Tax=Oculimacula yallundae TaxID=86028 RepID=A0ABR4BSC0_9HELO
MHHFKRVHGDYTLDDPLNPDLATHQYDHEESELYGLSATAPKRRRIVESSPQQEELPAKDIFQSCQKISLNENSTRGNMHAMAVEGPRKSMTATPVATGQHQPLPSMRTLLGILRPFFTDSTGFITWNTAEQKFVDARGVAIELVETSTVENQITKILNVMTLMGPQPTSANLFKVVPRNLYTQVLSRKYMDERDDRRWIGQWSRKHLTTKFVKDNTFYAAKRLGSHNLWPLADASFELRRELWKLYFCDDIVELVVGGWDPGTVDFPTILSSPADYLPRQWVWHVFQILLELRWKHNLKDGGKNLRSADTWSSASAQLVPVIAEYLQGPARKCLTRETWDDVVENFHLDVLETWGREPLEFMTINFLPGFGNPRRSSNSAVASLKRVAIQISKMPSHLLTPLVAQHLRQCPLRNICYIGMQQPFFSSSEDDSEDSGDDHSRGCERITNAAKQTKRQIGQSSKTSPSIEKIIARAKPSSQESATAAGKQKSTRDDVKIGGAKTSREGTEDESAQKNGSTTVVSVEHQIVEIENLGSESSFKDPSRPQDCLIPGAWDDKWQPEQTSFSEVSRAPFKWWTG